ncbi:MAG: hypothetical protein DMG06_30055 [Acidobacteria bacterium]|nr:MAG: hypothetical protein DMG06_30055 [Acidobacteriota bacterium]
MDVPTFRTEVRENLHAGARQRFVEQLPKNFDLLSITLSVILVSSRRLFERALNECTVAQKLVAGIHLSKRPAYSRKAIERPVEDGIEASRRDGRPTVNRNEGKSRAEEIKDKHQ